MKFLKLLFVLPLVAALGACSTIQTIERGYQTAKSIKVSPKGVIIAANAYDGLARTATNYIRLPPCQLTTNPVCSSDDAVAAIVPAVRSGRSARDQAIAFLKAHPNELGDQGAYDLMMASVATLRATFAQYNIGAAQ